MTVGGRIMSSQRYKLVIPVNCRVRLGSFLVAQAVKNLPAVQETGFDPWTGKIP